MDPVARRLTMIWAAMVALTLSSYTASESGFNHAAFGIGSIIVLAMIKVRFVVMEFMEVRHAPLPLRLVLEVWIAGLAIALIVLMS